MRKMDCFWLIVLSNANVLASLGGDILQISQDRSLGLGSYVTEIR